MRVELLKTAGCSHAAAAEGLVRDVLAELAPATALAVTVIDSAERAEASGFAGSPTIRVDGVDLEPDAPVLSGFG